MRKPLIFLCLVFIAVPAAFMTAYSQSIFLKNGSIIEGKIVKETDNALTITVEGEKMSIPRSTIIRIVYDNEYKQRVSIILMDGRTINGYVVEEGKGFYILRKELISTKELKISKKKINGILKKKDVIIKDEPVVVPIEDSSEFPGLAIWTVKKRYKPHEAIVVMFKNTPGGRYDWISLSKIDSPDDNYELYYYVNRRTEGELNFKKGLPAGEYEVRVYLHWSQGSYKVSKRYPFSVSE